jgi:hypothetical protein
MFFIVVQYVVQLGEYIMNESLEKVLVEVFNREPLEEEFEELKKAYEKYWNAVVHNLYSKLDSSTQKQDRMLDDIQYLVDDLIKEQIITEF